LIVPVSRGGKKNKRHEILKDGRNGRRPAQEGGTDLTEAPETSIEVRVSRRGREGKKRKREKEAATQSSRDCHQPASKKKIASEESVKQRHVFR